VISTYSFASFAGASAKAPIAVPPGFVWSLQIQTLFTYLHPVSSFRTWWKQVCQISVAAGLVYFVTLLVSTNLRFGKLLGRDIRLALQSGLAPPPRSLSCKEQSTYLRQRVRWNV